jgi:inward rectifier potassium channel
MSHDPHGTTRLLSRPAGSDVVRIGVRRRWLGDLYHTLLIAPWSLVLLCAALIYLGLNFAFAGLYLLDPGGIENARPGSLHDAFFFSVQTMATIGYGKMTPISTFANAVVTLEALCGLVGTAMITGLMFAKFSRITARVIFSDIALITAYESIPTFMFRMANGRDRNQIVEAELRVTLGRTERLPSGETLRRYYDLPLKRDRAPLFALTWIGMHAIDAGSPLAGATPESLREAEVEILVSIVGLDATFSQTVHARRSYLANEIRFGERFADVLDHLPDGRRLIDMRKFNQTVSG